MRYYKHLYLAKGIRKKEQVIRKLEENKLQMNIHIITLPMNGEDQLEIYHSMVLLQPEFPHDDFFVVGIAKDAVVCTGKYKGAILPYRLTES